MKHIILYSILIQIIILSDILSQTIFEPLNRDIYSYLSRISQRGIIDLDDQIKPLSRKYISMKLSALKDDNSRLTPIEKDELEFYLQEYGFELSFDNTDYKPSGDANFFKDDYGRYNFFAYGDSLFKININPILGYKKGSNDSKSQSHFWNGLQFHGYLTDNLGFSFDFRDNSEKGDNADRIKLFSDATGIIRSRSVDNSFEYSEVRTSISYDWNWGFISAGKEFYEWGYGKSGNIVHSTKSPSYPYIRLDIYPVSWLRFNYIHGWLASGVVDSSILYQTNWRSNDREQYRSKFIASHTLILTPINGLDLSFGESIVYSDRLEISYLMPLMFFRLADHYLSRTNNNAGANSQFFFGVSSRNHIPRTHLYGSLLIDEIVLSELFNPKRERNQIAFSFGASVTDLPVNNLTFTVEYSKTYPFVYTHYIPTQTYESNNYTLGHWIGHNADLVYGSVQYRIIRGLKTEIWLRAVRKGGEGSVDDQYTIPSRQFLFGLRKDYTDFGFNISYEIFHDLFVKAEYASYKSKSEQNDGSFIEFRRKEFYFTFNFGF